MPRDDITAEQVREYFDYDHSTGELIWKKEPGGAKRFGTFAGTLDNQGYIAVRFKGTIHRAHRLVWLWVHGDWPDGQVDHINQQKTDNRIENLRVVSNAENRQNTSARGCTFMGDKPRKKPWKAELTVDGVRHLLGYYATETEAKIAYYAAKREMHPFAVVNV